MRLFIRGVAASILLMNTQEFSKSYLLVNAASESESNMSIKPYKMVKISDDNLVLLQEQSEKKSKNKDLS